MYLSQMDGFSGVIPQAISLTYFMYIFTLTGSNGEPKTKITYF